MDCAGSTDERPTRLTVLRVPVADVELATDRLWSAGARAVEEVSGHGWVDLVTVLAGDDEVSVSRLGECPAEWSVAFVDARDAPSEAWRDHAVPIEVNPDLTIVPAWLGRESSRTPWSVEVEPSGAFGLGDHPTTRLSADATWRLVAPGDRVLDVGCGTGVLSVVAALRGATEVVAVDIAEAAREATLDNAARNRVAHIVEASVTPVSELDGAFDLVVANILAPTLVALADDFRRLTAASGRLLISGVLAESHGHVLQALHPMEVVATSVLDGWSAVELRHPGGGAVALSAG